MLRSGKFFLTVLGCCGIMAGQVPLTAMAQAYDFEYEELDLDYCRSAYEEAVPYALSNSLGFGGHNASLLFRRWEEM